MAGVRALGLQPTRDELAIDEDAFPFRRLPSAGRSLRVLDGDDTDLLPVLSLRLSVRDDAIAPSRS